MIKEEFFKPSVTVDILVFTIDKENKDIQILLIKRKNPPYKDCWAFPGGFIEKDETLEESAKRELEEETSIKIPVESLDIIGIAGNPNRDPRGRTISIIYYSFVKKNDVKPKGLDDAKEAQWFSIFNPPILAFDHKEILSSAISKISNTINNTFQNNFHIFNILSADEILFLKKKLSQEDKLNKKV